MTGEVKEITERMKTFRDMFLLPKPNDLDFESWLDNFQKQEEKELAARILKHFIYFSDDLINQMLRTVIGRCGYYFMQNVPEWNHDSFKSECWYSFIQGENLEDATDSGYIFTRKLRDFLGISNKRIVKFDVLFKILENNTSAPQNVILVDDFVGSGIQTNKAWNVHKLGLKKMTLSKLQSRFNHRIIYAPLVVNDMGLMFIKKHCPNLHLEYIYHLGPEYNLFNKNGLCWVDNYDLYVKFLNMMSRIAKEQNIPVTDGDSVNDMQGFAEQGLSLAFHHGIPDACPAFFYWDTPNWKPLKKRPYHR